MDPGGGAPDIVMTAAAVEFVRTRGGCLYMWADRAGGKNLRLWAPATAIQWRNHSHVGIELFLDPSIVEGDAWRVEVRRFPYRHLAVSS